MLHLRARFGNGEQGYLTTVYGSLAQTTRWPLWKSIKSIAMGMDAPWILVGGFNALHGQHDKLSGAAFAKAPSREFKSCVDDCVLMDVAFFGPKFTWQRGNLRERLDRALCNGHWFHRFPETHTTHLPKLKSDHHPIPTCLEG
ncbi:unnamed protein product [Linum trigynum]|uniref:Endonuclease/exonuclease/phosphatase domain-containing protein n=1 Tax=Linum trigynum TaxID=586398 RepID=A0AAV2FBH1_9ROSI